MQFIFFAYYKAVFHGITNNTRCSAIAERLRCRVHYSFRQKQKTGTGRNILRTL